MYERSQFSTTSNFNSFDRSICLGNRQFLLLDISIFITFLHEPRPFYFCLRVLVLNLVTSVGERNGSPKETSTFARSEETHTRETTRSVPDITWVGVSWGIVRYPVCSVFHSLYRTSLTLLVKLAVRERKDFWIFALRGVIKYY